MKKIGIFLFLSSFLFSCKTTNTYKDEFKNTETYNNMPKREAYPGFVWEKVSGAGIEFWAQRSKEFSVGISGTLPGAFVEKQVDGSPVALGLVIQVFHLKNQKIEDVFEVLQEDENWNQADACVFHKIDCKRKGVTRYELRPSGESLKAYQKQAEEGPVTNTCVIWGSGNSGIRYFEIHDTNKNKAIFIEVGQEAPLFDEESIVVK
jgi:hypothetical protein